MAKNMIIGQSGGPTVAINASLSGAVMQAMRHSEIGEIYGMLHGLEGVLKENIIDLRQRLRAVEDFRRMETTPATVLGSCRYKLPDYPHEAYDKIREVFHKFDIGYFFYIGGNDSMDTVLKLSRFFDAVGDDVKCMGIPKTIDNDLPCTDHTPGFGSAAKYVGTCVAEAACDAGAYDFASVTIIEVMGRNAGWLTAASVLARCEYSDAPHMILLPEVPFDAGAFIAKTNACIERYRNVVIAVSEGIKFPDGSYVASSGEAKVDAFGHQALTGVGKVLENLLKNHVGCKVRSIELSTLQRAAAHMASTTDQTEAHEIGAEAVRQAVAGQTGKMIIFTRVSDEPYLINYELAEISSVANLEKTVPAEWITADGWDVTQDMVRYLEPLIKGAPPSHYNKTIPHYTVFDKTPAKPKK